jgi:hypothetical protein
MKLVPLSDTLAEKCKKLFGVNPRLGLHPEHAYISILSISPTMSLGHPDREKLYDALWARLSYQIYAQSEGSILAWIAVAMQQKGYVRYDGQNIFPVTDLTIPMTCGLLQSITHKSGEKWSAEICLENFNTQPLNGTLAFIISHITLTPAMPRSGFPPWSINPSMRFPFHMSQSDGTTKSTSSIMHCSVPVCDALFQDELQLRQHNVEVHHISPPRSFNGYPQCWVCKGMPFANAHSLREHENHKHAD